MRRELSIALLALATACGASTEPRVPLLAVSTERTVLQQGDSVEVRLGNLADETLEFGECWSGLVRFEAGTWQRVAPPADRLPCLGRLLAIAPGATARLWAKLGASGAAGVYRLTYTVYDAASRLLPEEQRTSNPFRIQ